jgi:hypothetical protein
MSNSPQIALSARGIIYLYLQKKKILLAISISCVVCRLTKRTFTFKIRRITI